MSFDCSWPKLDELIHRAARQGRVLSLETYLNQYPAEKIDQQHDYGRSRWTLLIAACFYKHENIVRMLLRRFQPDADAIGDVKLDFVSDVMCGVSALWVAAAVGHLNIVQLLVEQGGANVNHLSVTRSSPLRAAAYIGHVDIARYLIAHGADMGLVRDGNYTNLMLSAYREHRSLVEYFLDELHCDPNEQDQDGRTPLHYAIDAGSVELVQVLLQRGARNSSQNEFSPVLWAALEARHDLVDAFHNFCSSDREWIEARELLGASYGNIESKNYDLDKAIEHLTLAYRWREEKHLPKVVPSTPPVEAYHFAQECQTLTEFNLILSESHARLHIESLLIQERILGPTSQRYRRAIRFYGALLADAHQYDRSIGLWLYELDLRRQHQIQLDKWHLRDFVHMFAEMIIHHVQQIPRRAILEILQVLHGELAHGDERDHHLLSLFYLITVISHVRCFSLARLEDEGEHFLVDAGRTEHLRFDARDLSRIGQHRSTSVYNDETDAELDSSALECDDGTSRCSRYLPRCTVQVRSTRLLC